MFKSLICFSLLFITLIQCGTIDVQFPTFPTDTDIGSCTCDLTVGQCDASCCCDRDCDSEDKKAFACDSRDNQFTNSTIVLSTVQPTCFKNISIFHSNSPYIIQKMGELVCVDSERYKGSQYYKQPINQIIDTSRFLSEINSDYAVLPAYSIPSDQTNYQVGTPILRNASTTNEQIFSLPSTLFDNNLCSASRSITYMNDFTSTCTQPVTSTTCTDVLDPRTYFNRLCFRQSPGNAVIICANIPTFTTPAFNSPTCSNALTSLTITVYYSNPTGITNVTTSRTIANVTGTVQQTFTVLFRKIESVQSVGSPGYRQGNAIQVGTATNSTISLTDSSLFNTYEPSTSGSCSGSLTVPVRFGESVQSTCKFTGTCSQLLDQLSPSDITNLYVAAYANSSLSNFTRDWLPIKIYKSDINYPELQESVASYSTLNVSGTCYTRLHVQVAYTNIGSIKNPQSVLSAVIFHYQYIRNSITTSITTILTKSITFQEIQNTPVVEQGRIPAPNTRLPENFFYPFSGNSATRSMTFSFEFYSFLCFYLASRMIYLI